MSAPRRRAGVATFLIGAVAALGGPRLVAPRPSPKASLYAEPSGRGAPGIGASAAAISAGHERVDADVPSIFRTMAIYGAAAIVSITLMALVLHRLHSADHTRDTGLTAIQKIQTTPPEPNLQADPVGDIARLRTHEYQLLHTLARIDADTARIPIDRAMALMAGQPLDRPDTQGDGRLPGQGAAR